MPCAAGWLGCSEGALDSGADKAGSVGSLVTGRACEETPPGTEPGRDARVAVGARVGRLAVDGNDASLHKRAAHQ